MRKKEPDPPSDRDYSPDPVTFSFSLEDVRSINIEAVGKGVIGRTAPPHFMVHIVVVPKPPPV